MQEQERRRLARDLHDEIGQLLTGLVLHLEMAARQSTGPVAERLVQAQAMLQELADRLRDLCAACAEPCSTTWA